MMPHSFKARYFAFFELRVGTSNWIEINDIICFPQLDFVTNHKISSFHIFNCSNQDL